jgi:hypothetical protein
MPKLFLSARMLILSALAAVSLAPTFASIQGEAKINRITAVRAAAVPDCSKESSKWSMISWQSTQITIYGVCMTGHGQQFE